MDVLAFAKINLSLCVGPRSDDGYHPIDSLIQTIDLADRITLEADPGGSVDSWNSLGIPSDRDLGAAAARAVLSEVGSSVGVRIHIDKRIPVGSGLGGGSSDAAAVLAATNSLLGQPLSPQDLRRLGMSLGADVPLFLVGGSLRMTGIGEIIQPVDSIREESFVLVVPRVHCNTAAVYGRFDELHPHRQSTTLGAMFELARNDLECAALDLYPDLAPVAAAVRSMTSGGGAVFVGMSGSGSAYFAAFRSAEAAAEASKSLTELLPEARIYLTNPTPTGHNFEGGQP